MEKINVYGDTHIYVLAPAFFKTGGTELLHQYVYILKKNNYNVDIVYPDATEEKNINENFNIYVQSYLNLYDIKDDERNILIIPEIYTNYLADFSNIRKIIWWESVDNYLERISVRFNIKKGLYKSAIKTFLYRPFTTIKHLKPKKLKTVDYHFVQSYYAMDFLKQNGIENNVFFVSDFINDIYLNSEFSLENRENIVLYNPKKGYRITKKIISKCGDLKFVPLINMTNKEVFSWLSKAKLYIDFGNHPGKDRFPREAAISGCCIITNKNGSANYYNDVMIPDEYKFDSKKKNITKIAKKIRECLDDYEKRISDFADYRKMISSEKEKFEKDILDCYKIN